MNRSEKNIIVGTLLTIAGLIGFAVYYELWIHDDESKIAGADSITTPVVAIPKGIIPEDLPDPESRGATLLTLYCVQCHDLPTPGMHGPDEWTAVLQRMENMMRSRRGGMISRVLMPGEKDWNILREYMQAHALPILAPDNIPDRETIGGQAFASTCSGCHAAPDPHQHAQNEWPRVVVRMRSNMLAAGQPVPPAEQIDLIIEYLQQHSSPAQHG